MPVFWYLTLVADWVGPGKQVAASLNKFTAVTYISCDCMLGKCIIRYLDYALSKAGVHMPTCVSGKPGLS